MEPPGSTVVGYLGERKPRLRRFAVRILGGNWSRFPPDKMTALLLPMVSRAVRTARGPTALLWWLHRSHGAPPASHQTERVARTLTEDLVRFLFDSSSYPTDTVDDSR